MLDIFNLSDNQSSVVHFAPKRLVLDIFNLSKMSGPNAKKAKVATEFDPREDASSPSSIEEEYFSAEEEPAAGPSTLLQSIEPVDMARRQKRVRFCQDTKQEDGEGSRAYRARLKAQRRTIQ